MWRLLILVMLLGTTVVRGQSTNAPAAKVPATTNTAPTLTGQSLETQSFSPGFPGITFSELKANELAKGRVIYSGIAVETAKKHHPWQLFNPLASPEYGSSEDNLVRDPINGRPTGLKIFAIRF